ncbi:MAG: HAD family hydrolase [Bacteroidales bacterium]
MNKISSKKIVVTDFDGTLLSSEGRVSDTDYNTLVELGKMGIIRAIATGRSPYSFTKVVASDFPIDYLIFSSGAGTMNWQVKEISYTTELTPKEVQGIVNELVNHNVDFMVHEPIPSNHRFLYHKTGSSNPDFERRIDIYNQFCQPFIPGVLYDSPATQILAVLPCNVGWFENLKKRFPSVKVIRATSPLDGTSIWMEIFRKNVSKAYGIEWLCRELNVKPNDVVTIGNDFNDLDMLCQFDNSFVVNNAPSELKEQFPQVQSNNNSGFTDAVSKGLGIEF